MARFFLALRTLCTSSEASASSRASCNSSFSTSNFFLAFCSSWTLRPPSPSWSTNSLISSVRRGGTLSKKACYYTFIFWFCYLAWCILGIAHFSYYDLLCSRRHLRGFCSPCGQSLSDRDSPHKLSSACRAPSCRSDSPSGCCPVPVAAPRSSGSTRPPACRKLAASYPELLLPRWTSHTNADKNKTVSYSLVKNTFGFF